MSPRILLHFSIAGNLFDLLCKDLNELFQFKLRCGSDNAAQTVLSCLFSHIMDVVWVYRHYNFLSAETTIGPCVVSAILTCAAVAPLYCSEFRILKQHYTQQRFDIM